MQITVLTDTIPILVDIADLKGDLKIEDNLQDDHLELVVKQATKALETRLSVGLYPKTLALQAYYMGDTLIKLYQTPIIEIDSIVSSLDGSIVDLALVSLYSDRVIKVQDGLTGTYTITYQAGFETLPEALYLALRQLSKKIYNGCDGDIQDVLSLCSNYSRRTYGW